MAKDLGKLPKWARERIEQLERTVDRLHEERRARGDAEADTALLLISKDGQEFERHGLGAGNPMVSFRTNGGDFEVRRSNGTGNEAVAVRSIRVRLRGDGVLRVEPVSPNAVEIMGVDSAAYRNEQSSLEGSRRR